MSLYPEVLENLRSACSQFRENLIGIEQLQAVVQQAEEQVTAHEERDLRKFLHRAEGELELIRFTVNEVLVFQETLRVVSQIEETVRRAHPE